MANEQDDIAERIIAILNEREESEKKLDELTELKHKYKIGCLMYDEYI